MFLTFNTLIYFVEYQSATARFLRFLDKVAGKER